jgi:hypothetical protein
MATWRAREWVAGLMGLDEDGLAVRSIDRYGEQETQVRYERGDEAVARLTVTGPVRPMGVAQGAGHWVIKAHIGSGMGDVHQVEVPEGDEIEY